MQNPDRIIINKACTALYNLDWYIQVLPLYLTVQSIVCLVDVVRHEVEGVHHIHKSVYCWYKMQPDRFLFLVELIRGKKLKKTLVCSYLYRGSVTRFWYCNPFLVLCDRNEPIKLCVDYYVGHVPFINEGCFLSR
jgi:hypothetical protein